jgi:uncharacterized protein (TIGR00159 family)
MRHLVGDLIFNITLIDIIDISIISYIIYRVLLLIKGTSAYNMLFGILFLVFLSFLSNFIGLKTTSWVLNNFSGYLFLAIIILFAPEIRRALAFIGETKVFTPNQQKSDIKDVIEEIIKASTLLANKQIGALIVLERNSDITQFAQGSQKIDSLVTKDLLISIFIPYSPLHDGAVIIRDGKIAFAGAVLPLTKKNDIDEKFGTRHRAAIGITEETDAVCVVVSEENGTIAVTVKGHITTELDSEMLRETLNSLMTSNK